MRITFLFCLLLTGIMSFAQSQAETEKWISETLRKNAVAYKAKRNYGDNRNAGSLSHVTYDNFSFTFNKHHFIIHCKMISTGDTARGAALPVEIRIPLYDLQAVSEDLSFTPDDRYYRLAFQTGSNSIQYQVFYSVHHVDARNYYSIRLSRENNEQLIAQLSEAFVKIKPFYKKPKS